MILEIDMGNTRIKWRLRSNELVVLDGFIDTESDPSQLEIPLAAYCNTIQFIWIASVVDGKLESRISDWARNFFSVEPRFARPQRAFAQVLNGYQNPDLLGVDRWLGVVAAYSVTKTACVVVSFGTAATADIVDAHGRHLGGFIGPGLTLMVKTLCASTRRISVDSLDAKVRFVPGASTLDAVSAGCAAMLIGFVDNAVNQLAALSGGSECQLVFTGGDAERFTHCYPGARFIEDLVLNGLALVMTN